ncbi:MAG: hypothetical protein OHK0022_10650 [Roseiflexaceae bacterium]
MKLTPSKRDFLYGPLGNVIAVAPPTAIYTTGGTRRAAALHGIAPGSAGYLAHARQHMFEAIQVFFHCGIQHLFVGVIRSHRFRVEDDNYRTNVCAWVADGLTNAQSLEDYRVRGWRTRLVGGEAEPILAQAAQRLRDATPEHWTKTIWFFADLTPDGIWQAIAQAARAGATTQAEFVRALYGEDIPLATLCVQTGRPMSGLDLYPCVIAGQMQCYWQQRPGYALSEKELRAILYDFAYTRPSTGADDSNRYAQVVEQRALWQQQQAILGLGQRVGPFWYPLWAPEEEQP